MIELLKKFWQEEQGQDLSSTRCSWPSWPW